jgi:hypothetical protein
MLLCYIESCINIHIYTYVQYVGMNMSIDINSINTDVYCDAVPDW